MDERIATIAGWLGTGSLNVFGPPFAGKDTQCKALAQLLGGVVISSGDILRHDHGNTEIQRIMAAGGIIPSELFASVVAPYLSKSEFVGKPLILSEVGRINGEHLTVMNATAESGHALKAVILLGLPDEEAFRRFDVAQVTHDRGTRKDDRREVIQTRLNAYRTMVTPVIDFYRNHGLLIEIDGTPPPEEITKTILEELSVRATRSS